MALHQNIDVSLGGRHGEPALTPHVFWLVPLLLQILHTSILIWQVKMRDTGRCDCIAACANSRLSDMGATAATKLVLSPARQRDKVQYLVNKMQNRIRAWTSMPQDEHQSMATTFQAVCCSYFPTLAQKPSSH